MGVMRNDTLGVMATTPWPKKWRRRAGGYDGDDILPAMATTDCSGTMATTPLTAGAPILRCLLGLDQTIGYQIIDVTLTGPEGTDTITNIIENFRFLGDGTSSTKPLCWVRRTNRFVG